MGSLGIAPWWRDGMAASGMWQRGGMRGRGGPLVIVGGNGGGWHKKTRHGIAWRVQYGYKTLSFVVIFAGNAKHIEEVCN